MTVWGVVVAAGRGRRFGAPKHDVLLAGRPLWRRARDALLEGGCEEVVVVGSVPGGIRGGARRRDSVVSGLRALPERVDTVVVHDAARPLAGAELVATVLARLEHGDVDGVVPVLPVRDTIKRVEGDLVMTTLTREGLVTVQTPQAFRRSVLWEAHAGSDRDAPDDAALVEQAGGKVAVVEGDPRNLKITYAEDLRIAEALLG